MLEEKSFRLKWDDFNAGAMRVFKSIRKETELCDVSLYCSDTKIDDLLEAHKVILSSFSPIFRQMLVPSSQRAEPITSIFFRGISHKNLSHIIDFIYVGEINIAKGDLDSFLSLAKDLAIEGIGDARNKDEFSMKSEVSKVKNLVPTKSYSKNTIDDDLYLMKPIKADISDDFLMKDNAYDEFDDIKDFIFEPDPKKKKKFDMAGIDSDDGLNLNNLPSNGDYAEYSTGAPALTVNSTENSFLRDKAIIDFMKHHPELWDRSLWKTKQSREVLWQELFSKMQEEFPNSMKIANGSPIDTIEKLKFLWRTKKSQYFQTKRECMELKRIKDSGFESTLDATPKWKLYDYLTFLDSSLRDPEELPTKANFKTKKGLKNEMKLCL